MAVHGGLLRLDTPGNGEIVDLTPGVQSVLRTAGMERGVVTVFATGSTVAITTMEYEPGGVSDFQALLERLIPQRDDYEHNRLNHDTNAHAHLRAALIGPSETVPFIGGGPPPRPPPPPVLIHFRPPPPPPAGTAPVTSFATGGPLL